LGAGGWWLPNSSAFEVDFLHEKTPHVGQLVIPASMGCFLFDEFCMLEKFIG